MGAVEAVIPSSGCVAPPALLASPTSHCSMAAPLWYAVCPLCMQQRPYWQDMPMKAMSSGNHPTVMSAFSQLSSPLQTVCKAFTWTHLV